MATLIQRIENENKKNGIRYSDMAKAMGYSSGSTVLTWVQNGTIPTLAQDRVKKYFAKKKGK